ncbi:hypothetical protein LSAT2_014437 [Lamellibrachia satsuma]|nr:hypothetical protein LSAT2_014437 [Lamellibrachia satsuma]
MGNRSRYYEEQYYRNTGHQKYPSGRGGYAESRYRPYPRGRGGVEPHRHPIGPGAPSQPPAGANESSESSALLNLAKCLVSNEDEAKAALQISNKLAEALLEYHRRKEPSQADHGPSGHGNSVQGNPQGDMSGNVQGGTMETNLCGYAAPEVDYNHGYGGNMGGNIDYSLTETIEAPAQPFTGDYSYAQPW